MALLVGGTASHAEPASETEPAPHAEPASHPAIATIEGLHVSMLETMQNADELGYQGRYDKLGNALAVSFDLDFMAQAALLITTQLGYVAFERFAMLLADVPERDREALRERVKGKRDAWVHTELPSRRRNSPSR